MGSSPLRSLLLPYVLRYRRQFFLGLLCVVVTTAIQLLPPWVLKYAVDDLSAGVTTGEAAAVRGDDPGHRAASARCSAS